MNGQRAGNGKQITARNSFLEDYLLNRVAMKQWVEEGFRGMRDVFGNGMEVTNEVIYSNMDTIVDS